MEKKQYLDDEHVQDARDLATEMVVRLCDYARRQDGSHVARAVITEALGITVAHCVASRAVDIPLLTESMEYWSDLVLEVLAEMGAVS